MAVIRVEKNKNYTCMANYHLRDKKLSLKAKGLLSMILSLPDNWKYSMAGLVAICKEGESAVKAAFKELEKGGYITVTKLYPNQTESGRIEYAYTVREKPIQDSCGQGVENQGVAHQVVENQGQLSTEELSTDKPNTEEKVRKASAEARKAPVAEIIAHLNAVTGKRYSNKSRATIEAVNARWAEYTNMAYDERLELFIGAIDNMAACWTGTRWEQYLNPTTLFRKTKFDAYANMEPKRWEEFGSEDKIRGTFDEFSLKHKTGAQTTMDFREDGSNDDEITF